MSNKRIALVFSSVNMRRFTPGLKPFVSSGVDYWYIDVYRPLPEIFTHLQNWDPDGIITEELPGITSAFLTLNKPTIVSPSEITGPNLHGVNVDDYKIGELIAEEFLRRGFKNLACYSQDAPFSFRRVKGFLSVLESHGINMIEREEQNFLSRQYLEYWSSFSKEMSNWLKSLPKPIGIFATHDPLGRSLAEACGKYDYAIPEDIAIIAANNDDMVCGLTNPPLSSIKIPWNLIAQKSMNILLEMINGKHTANESPTIIPPLNIVNRQSSDIMKIDDSAVTKALQYIRTCAQNDIHVPDIAKYAGVSRRRLEQKFHSVLGRTPREEVLRVRIGKAKELLINSDNSMSRIAEECGFNDQERLSVNFKKLLNISPSQYRKKYRN